MPSLTLPGATMTGRSFRRLRINLAAYGTSKEAHAVPPYGVTRALSSASARPTSTPTSSLPPHATAQCESGTCGLLIRVPRALRPTSFSPRSLSPHLTRSMQRPPVVTAAHASGTRRAWPGAPSRSPTRACPTTRCAACWTFTSPKCRPGC